MVADENIREQKTKNIKNKAKFNNDIQTRREPPAKFGGDPTKILGGVRVTEVGGSPSGVKNGAELICIFGILVYSDE